MSDKIHVMLCRTCTHKIIFKYITVNFIKQIDLMLLIKTNDKPRKFKILKLTKSPELIL